jgi:hypothetical protein
VLFAAPYAALITTSPLVGPSRQTRPAPSLSASRCNHV